MEVEYKAEKSQEEKERSVLSSQLLEAARKNAGRMLRNGPVSSQVSISIYQALDALFQRLR